MTAIAKGAAATKAPALWSTINSSEGYPRLLRRVNDRPGTPAMLSTHAGMDAAGFGILSLAAGRQGLRYRSHVAKGGGGLS